MTNFSLLMCRMCRVTCHFYFYLNYFCSTRICEKTRGKGGLHFTRGTAPESQVVCAIKLDLRVTSQNTLSVISKVEFCSWFPAISESGVSESNVEGRGQ